MRTATDLKHLEKKRRPVFLAAGFFDGVHLGHQKVLSETIARAGQADGEAWVLTFDSHPLKVLNPARAPLLLTSREHKLRLLGRTKLDGCLMLPFTRELAAMEPAAFVRELRKSVPSLSEICIGTNWRFGREGRGTPRLLSRMARALGFGVTVIRPVVRGGQPVSSTRIRAALTASDLDGAALMLGRPFSVLGTVGRGRAVGRQLGYPTANLLVGNEVLPPHGVYAVGALFGEGSGSRTHGGILYLGIRPTFGPSEQAAPFIELHVFDMDRDLYGAEIEVFFLQRVRGEKRFASAAALQKRIGIDTKEARRALPPPRVLASLGDTLSLGNPL